MFGSRKKNKSKVQISAPSNFEHRVHTGYDPVQHGYVGLPSQWANVVVDTPPSNQRPRPIVDPSLVTPVKVCNIALKSLQMPLLATANFFVKIPSIDLCVLRVNYRLV